MTGEPGSPAAVEQGCTCPVIDNHHGRGFRDDFQSYVISGDCPLHAGQFEPDWTRKCENCGETPIVPVTGLCGPCTWGEAETIGGNW